MPKISQDCTKVPLSLCKKNNATYCYTSKALLERSVHLLWVRFPLTPAEVFPAGAGGASEPPLECFTVGQWGLLRTLILPRLTLRVKQQNKKLLSIGFWPKA